MIQKPVNIIGMARSMNVSGDLLSGLTLINDKYEHASKKCIPYYIMSLMWGIVCGIFATTIHNYGFSPGISILPLFSFLPIALIGLPYAHNYHLNQYERDIKND